MNWKNDRNVIIFKKYDYDVLLLILMIKITKFDALTIQGEKNANFLPINNSHIKVATHIETLLITVPTYTER